MIVVMKTSASERDLQEVIARIEQFGFATRSIVGSERATVSVLGAPLPDSLQEALERMPGVEEVVRITKRYKLASREFHPDDTVIHVGDVAVGGNEVVVIAGPCSVESEAQIIQTAHAVKAAGASMLRGGAFKPRTSPYDFRGLGEEGLRLLAKARAETGLPIVTEVLSVADLDMVAEYADVLQIGARNTQNFLLLEAVGKTQKPVLLKRGMSTQIEEWLLAAEYIMAQGNEQVMLCERGIRTFETITRNTLDLSAVPVVKRLSHLPIIVDPSHGTGKWYLVPSMMLAAVASGADGLIVEVHPNPDHALSDGSQSLTFENFSAAMPKLARVAEAVGRTVRAPQMEMAAD
ncbi:3-deoxy-7-phosphoheptulonate synthase [Sphaerobacter thermophilus]|uniref:Phospho-2-dehydro-3-deoxyheptonate aldolase n=1 Tax=Sphaerobacter thermophilus (strain ATCC 49802 / DSM 20745 / KCCM 41009 / NCIMB 13125 / S 6022) TaxID=479434 RepID=D1C4Y6_SPHTD|nr:3-deoxy-7-phosphoheptulonate synthase [Sphaerobacter thermophilus]ACZ39303.1 phospho-2-dehydro-3-deoxyheptonate aldolase [Sphaerobacter thermophilus DSM 20745]PZN66866.1 MAG: 3-deoxy-7-phosphoheptulonate synthase [Sphaerobacter thermophilus]